MASLDAHESEIERPIAARKREAEDWVLVLIAEGYAPTLRRETQGWSVEVAPERAAEAARLISAWRTERAERADLEHARRNVPVPRASSLETATAYALALSLLAFHLGVEHAGRHAALVEVGQSRAVLVLSGEAWRTVTALTLHADLPHVLGNTLFGGFFLAAVAARLGMGCAVLAFLVSGVLGNAANAVYYGVGHSSIGASTGVFGLVGVLAGLAAWQRHQTAPRGRGAWVAFAAGLAIVAMLGSGGPRVDLSAHLFGLAAGGLSGLFIAVPLAGRPRPDRRSQLMAFALTFATIAGAWALAGTHAAAPLN